MGRFSAFAARAQGQSASNGLGRGQDLGQGHSKGDVIAMQQAQQMGVTLFKVTGNRDFLGADKFYTVTFTTLNGSGVTGEAILAYDLQTNRLTVAISASGLEPDMIHIQHIHGFPDGTDARTPTLALDSDGDGFIELAEGLTTYGPILLDLKTNHANDSGADNGHSHDGGGLSGFPTAPDGTIWFVESYQLPAGMLTDEPMLDLRELVIHGMTVDGSAGAGTPGEIDGTAGFKLVLPVASGEIEQVSSAASLKAFIAATGFDDDASAAAQFGAMQTLGAARFVDSDLFA